MTRDPLLSPAYPLNLPGNAGLPYDLITLTGLSVSCIIGVYPSERDVPQPLNLDVWLYLNTRQAAHSGSLRYSVDYARLAGELRFLLESCQFLLLETAADALCHYLLAPSSEDAPRAAIFAVALRLTKPQALGRGLEPALTVWRSVEEVKIQSEKQPFGWMDILYQTRGCGIYRLRLAPGASIQTHQHEKTVERELVLGDGLQLQGRSVRAGVGVAWELHQPHRYDNPTKSVQSILCVNRPSYLPEDQVPVEVLARALVLPPLHDYYTPQDASAHPSTAGAGF